MFFIASAENIRDYLKYTKKRARKLRKRMGKNLFLHAMSAAKLRTRQTSSLLEYFSQRQRVISVVCDDCYFSSTKECGLPPQRKYSRFLKYTKKRARKLRKRMGKNLFLHAMSAAKLRTRQTSSLLEYFSQRQRVISVVCDDCYFSSTKECGLPPQRKYSRFFSNIRKSWKN